MFWANLLKCSQRFCLGIFFVEDVFKIRNIRFSYIFTFATFWFSTSKQSTIDFFMEKYKPFLLIFDTFSHFLKIWKTKGCPYVIRRTKEVMMEEVCFLKRLAFVILHGIDRYVAREVTEDLGPPGLSPRGIYLLWQRLTWQKYSAIALFLGGK